MTRDTFKAKGESDPGATKIVIHIEGGCLHSVYADQYLEVVLLDEDNHEGDASDDFEEALDAATDGLQVVW